MPSQSTPQQHLTPANMSMIERALARVRRLYNFNRHSEDETQAASVMIGEFQRGNSSEDGLVAVYLGVSGAANLAVAEIRLRKSLERWDNEGGIIVKASRTDAQRRVDNDMDGTRRRANETQMRNRLV